VQCLDLLTETMFGSTLDPGEVAKGIASGLPLGALMARDDVMQWNDGGHGTTFGGNPVSAAAALATLDLLEQGLIENAATMGRHLIERCRGQLARHACVGDVRGLGLMIGLDIVKDPGTREPDPALRQRIIRQAFERGLILIGCGKSTIRLSPPLTIDAEDADIALGILDQTLAACTAQ
jgi:4-aminobutyrate aminotransferase